MANNSFKFVHAAHISPSGKPRPAQNQNWGMLMAGLACGFLGMYFTITRPMSGKIQSLESNIAVMQGEIHQLTGAREELWKTNDLLSGLRQQQRQMIEAEQALSAVRNLKNEVLSLAASHEQAMDTLQQFASLQKSLIENRNSLEQSQDALAEVQSFQQNVARLGDEAVAQQVQITAASETLNKVEEFTSRTLDQKDSIESAQSVISSVDKLTSSLTTQGEALVQSSEVVEKMEALQSRLNQQTQTLPAASNSLDQLASLENRLAQHDSAVTEKATANLNALKNLGLELSSGSDRITSAVQTIELLEDFQVEVERQATVLTNMRRDLMEIAFLESAVKQTLQVLKPLVQLTDMRRMSDTEVREAARVIMDRRISDHRLHKDGEAAPRIADRPEDANNGGTVIEKAAEEPQVPTPIELN